MRDIMQMMRFLRNLAPIHKLFITPGNRDYTDISSSFCKLYKIGGYFYTTQIFRLGAIALPVGTLSGNTETGVANPGIDRPL